MPLIFELTAKQEKFIKKRGLSKKWFKIKVFLENDLNHPSLNWKKIIVKSNVVYSFRLDYKYRGICYLKENGIIEVISFTNHYQ